MSPEEENGRLLRGIASQVDRTHERIIRVEERLVNLNDRVTKLDTNVEVIRSCQQKAGTEVALLQSSVAGLQKHQSGLQRQVNVLDNGLTGVEQTGQILVQKSMQTWKVIAVVGSIFVTVAGLALGVAKLVL